MEGNPHMTRNILGTLALPQDHIVVNADDIADASWPTLFSIRLETGSMWLTEAFIVAADSLQDALDEIADYCVERGWTGYVADGSEVEIDDDGDTEGYIPAGNGNTYLRDTGSICVDTLAVRDGYGRTWKALAA